MTVGEKTRFWIPEEMAVFGNPFKTRMPTPDEALPGRERKIAAPPKHFVLGTRLEERDLRRFHPEYESYARAVPAFVPRVGNKRPATAADLA